jgi:hypothetical protein
MLTYSDLGLDSFTDNLGKPAIVQDEENEYERSVEVTLNKRYVESNIDYLCEEIGAWIEESEMFEVVSHPLFQELTNLRFKGKPRSKAAKSRSFGDTEFRRTSRNIDKFVLEKRNPPCVTPLIYSIGKNFFDKHVTLPLKTVTETNKEAEETQEAMSDLPTIVPDEELELGITYPTKRSARNALFVGDEISSSGTLEYYSEAKVDDETIKCGDFVFCASTEKNTLPYVMRVQYMYFNSNVGANYFHGRYFLPASKTLLEETASPLELCAVEDCGTAKLERILGKIECKYLVGDEKEPTDGLFYRFI